jgi:MOSC domain-containing protein YiiM
VPTPRIFQISASQGGVPKLALREAAVTTDGLTVDAQADLKHHGGPDRALCLWSLELILALQEEGHPVFPGAAGENLTLSGVDWSGVVPGRRLRLGAGVEIEIVSYTAPCATIKRFFLDERSNRISQKHHPGWSRVYARVAAGGNVVAGDPVAFI